MKQDFSWPRLWAEFGDGILLGWVFAWLVPFPTIGLLYILGLLP